MKPLMYQFHLLRAMRMFFDKKGFTEVLTPPMVENPGMEVHIHPFEIYQSKSSSSTGKYLHTSPEFHMKKILTDFPELKDIYTISYCFRDEPQSEIHREQFLMCEWYRAHQFYTKIMDDCEELIQFCSEYLGQFNPKVQGFNSFQRVTIQELFQEYLSFDILNFLDTKDLKQKIQKDFPEVPLPSQELPWDDYYFLLFLNKVEPVFKDIPYILLYNFPHHLSALSTLNQDDPRVCDRFEIYLNGIELCNSFNELRDVKEQKERFDKAHHDKKELYQYQLPEPTEFYQTLEKGLPESCGIALGVERLLKSLTGQKEIFLS